VQVRPGQRLSGRAGSECCLSSGDRRVEAYTARKQAVRVQLRNRFIIATPTPLAWRKAASGKPIMRGCPGSPQSLVPTVNPKQLSIACESVDNHGDGDLLKLIWYAVAGLFRSRAALQTEVLALRRQLNVLRRRAPKRVTVSATSIAWCLRGSITWLRDVGRAENPQAGDHHQMASRWVPSLVALEIKAGWRSTQDT
jgi:hypothetical protein